MALVEFKDGRPVEGSLEGVDVVEIPEGVEEIAESAFEGQDKIQEIIIPDTVRKIGDYAFRHCESLEKLYIPDSVRGEFVTFLGRDAFTHCKNLKELRLPYTNQVERQMFFDCRSLEKVDLSAGVSVIENHTFSDCPNLKEVDFGEKPSVYRIAEDAFEGCPEELKLKFGGISLPYKNLAFTRTLSDGLSLERDFAVLQKAHDILRDETFSPILIKKLCNAEHAGKLDATADKIKKSFQTIGFYEISDDVDIKAKENLIELFKNNTATRGVVPRIIDALTIASTTLNIPPEDLVKSFEDKKFRDAIIAMRTCHEGNHFFDVEATLFAMTFDVNTIKQFILENPYKDYASVLLCEGYKDKKENCINTAKWIAAHPGCNRDVIKDIFAYKDFIQIAPDMTVDAVKRSISQCRAELEVQRIEERYDGFKLSECKCELPKVEVELGRYRAYIMDGQDPRQVMLGYDTYCCQHLDGAGETAMMYGLTNDEAGFFVVEDKVTGKILAQAETWQCSESLMVQRGEAVSFKSRNLKKLLEAFIETEYADDVANEIGYDIWTNKTGDTCYGVDEDSPIYTVGASISVKNPEILLYDMGENTKYREKFNSFAKSNAMYGKYMQLDVNGNVTEMESWKPINNMLVFDNIEFTDDREIEQFAPIIAKWCEAAPYKNIAMGNGYNEMSSWEVRQIEGIEPPIDTNYIKSIMAVKFSEEIAECIPEIEDTTFSDIFENLIFENKLYENLEEAGFLKQDENGDYYGVGPLEQYGSYLNDFVYDITQTAEKPYTDADESCSVLKFEGKVEPYFADALEEYLSKQQERKQSAPDKHKSRGR